MRRGRPRRASSGDESFRELPAPMDMPVSDGVEHREAPERFPDAARTPRKLRVSSRSAGFRVGRTPWDAGPTHRGLRVKAPAQMPRTQACEGTSHGESRDAEPGMTCFEGGSEALEPRPWDQIGRAQASSSPWSFRPRIPQSSRLQSTRDGRTQRAQRCVTAFPTERASRAQTPGAAADLASPQGRRESKPSRGRETPRTDSAGLAGPGHTDPSADVAEGARNPRRGDPVRHDRGGRIGPHPERETKSVGAAGRSSDRTDGRSAEVLVVVETTRRRRPSQ